MVTAGPPDPPEVRGLAYLGHASQRESGIRRGLLRPVFRQVVDTPELEQGADHDQPALADGEALQPAALDQPVDRVMAEPGGFAGLPDRGVDALVEGDSMVADSEAQGPRLVLRHRAQGPGQGRPATGPPRFRLHRSPPFVRPSRCRWTWRMSASDPGK